MVYICMCATIFCACLAFFWYCIWIYMRHIAPNTDGALFYPIISVEPGLREKELIIFNRDKITLILVFFIIFMQFVWRFGSMHHWKEPKKSKIPKTIWFNLMRERTNENEYVIHVLYTYNMCQGDEFSDFFAYRSISFPNQFNGEI